MVCKVDKVQWFTETITTGFGDWNCPFLVACRIYCPQYFAITHVNPLRSFYWMTSQPRLQFYVRLTKNILAWCGRDENVSVTIQCFSDLTEGVFLPKIRKILMDLGRFASFSTHFDQLTSSQWDLDVYQEGLNTRHLERMSLQSEFVKPLKSSCLTI